jgi:hypothetical protein
MMGATMGLMLANFEWNIFLRGILFPAIMFIILCGSSYLLMATNMGNRLGFLVAAAGLAGWMFLMSIVWMLYGIGLRGKDPSWKVADVITGTNNLNIAQNQNVSAIANLPFQSSWCKTDADVADSEAAKAAAKMPDGIAKSRAVTAAEKAVEAQFAARRATVSAVTGRLRSTPHSSRRSPTRPRLLRPSSPRQLSTTRSRPTGRAATITCSSSASTSSSSVTHRIGS